MALCFVAILTFLKTTQISATDGSWPIGRRLWHMFGVVDTRRASRVSPAMDLPAIGVVLLNGAFAAGAVFGLTNLGALHGVVHVFAWTIFSAAFAVSVFEVFSGLLHIGYLAFGVEVPAVQCNPIVSRSLAEFWGQRWNRIVSGWLREFAFDPLARRRRPQLGVAAAFGASAAMHAWLIVALGAGAALMMAAYFLLQGAALYVETRIGLRRAPPVVGRLWTVAVLLVPLPLLFDAWFAALGNAFFGNA